MKLLIHNQTKCLWKFITKVKEMNVGTTIGTNDHDE